MQRRNYENDGGVYLADLVKIAVGVFIGGLAAAFAYEGITALRLEYAAQKAVQEIRHQSDRANAQAVQQQRQQMQLQQQQRIDEENARKFEAEQQRASIDRRERREAAWRAFYIPSQACQEDRTMVACANAHIAAKKRFNDQYVDH